MVDVITEIIISKPSEIVAEYAMNPDNAPEWYLNIKSVEWKTPKPLATGTQIVFVANFLGRKLEYTYEFIELIPGKKLLMRTAEGPFPMETTYLFNKFDNQSTKMTLRNKGNPKGFSKLVAPLMAKMIQRENKKDLKKIKTIIENM